MNVPVVDGPVHRYPVRREHTLKGGQMLRIAVDEGSVEVEEKRRNPVHIVAPICQGVNSASP